MRNHSYLLGILTATLFVVSCKKEIAEVDYIQDIAISFQGVGDSNIVQLGKGTAQYIAKIDVKSGGKSISNFEIYNADPRTGVKTTLISGTAEFFESGTDRYATDFAVQDLVDNRCIKIVVTDTAGRAFEKNLFVRITPAVDFSQTLEAETVENYYGPYYATWLSGRVYMRRNEEHKAEIDLSLGDVVIDAEGPAPVPALVNPAKRASYGLLTIAGLQDARFDSTTLTKADYDNVTKVNAAPITALPDPQQDVLRLKSNKVYVFKTANGKKGLIWIGALTQKSGTIERTEGNWIPNTTYYEAAMTTKTIIP